LVTDITSGVKVSVETEYQAEYSSPTQQHYVFTYRISIENLSDKTIRLKSRHWEIHDATFAKRDVAGEGVVGKQPILEPGSSHQYVSGCNLRSGIGKMQGYYTMEIINSGKTFTVNIPAFNMVVPTFLN
jgi:ApaG protein